MVLVSENSAVREYTKKSAIDLMLANNTKIIMYVESIPSVSLDSDLRASDIRQVIGKLRLKWPYRIECLVRERYAVKKL